MRVNTPVDTDIADLISSLSAFPRLQTIESCQGNSNNPAWVCFYYGNYWLHSWRDLANFLLGYLGPAMTRKLGDRVGVSIRVTESGQIHGELMVRPGAIQVTVRALKTLLRDFGG